jgi:hypothetical protein
VTASIFFALSVATCILCGLAAIAAAIFARRLAESQGPRECSCESRVRSLTASVEDQATAMLDLANRMKMIKVRSASNHAMKPDGPPDPFKDPDGWRRAMNARIVHGKLSPE